MNNSEIKRKKTVLIADDEQDLLKVLSFKVAQRGYEVILAKSGAEVVELVSAKKPDIVVLDYWMPKKNGDEVLEWMRSEEKFKHIPVIFITASTERNVIKKIVLAKADERMIKPFDIEELLNKIKNLIGE